MNTIDVTPSGDPYVDSLMEGPKWAETTLTYSFPTSAAQFTGYGPGEEPSSGFAAMTAQQQAAVRAILGQIASFTNLTFTEATGAGASSAVLRFGSSDLPDTAWGYLPDPAEFGGDAWFNRSGGDYAAPVIGNYAWHGFLHEIGHTLGLGHPHESDPPMPLDRDWMAYTVMTYRSYQGATADAESTYTNSDWGYPQSFMMEDIAALQAMYGANFDFRSGDTTYTWSPTTGEAFVDGVGQGAPGANVIFQTIWDGGGNDTYDFSNYGGRDGTTIDLRPGSFTDLLTQFPLLGGGSAPGEIATSLLYDGNFRSLIENAVGTSGYDTIQGNQADNHLVGGPGDDTLWGWDGDDLLEGNDGHDLIYGGLGNDKLVGGSGADSNQYDNMYGDEGNDWLIGGAGGDGLYGGDGNDRLEGGPGSNSLYGDAGDDTLIGGANYDDMRGGDGADSLDGGDGGDLLDGGSGADTLIGGAGNDTLMGNGGDSMAGGAGDDTYWLYSGENQVVEQAGEGIDTAYAGFDFVLPNTIENGGLIQPGGGGASLRDDGPPPSWNLTGNELDNVLTGNTGDNVIDGGTGSDTMSGYGGNDTYVVDSPDDIILENIYVPGTDTVYASLSYNLPTHSSLGNSDYGVENLIFSGSGDFGGNGNELNNSLTGNSGANTLDGRAGNDTLSGNDGNDVLISGAGTDTLHGDGGDDGLFFGGDWDASDIADGGAGHDQVGVQGAYYGSLTLAAGSLAGVEQLVFLPGDDARFGDTAGNYYSYYLTTADANVAAGQQIVVTANTLRTGEDFTFDGSAELDGSFLTYGGGGNDTVIGGQLSDGFFFGYGRWGSGDRVDGQGGGLDQLGLQGNYTAAGSGAVVFGASQLAGIELVVCISGGDTRFGGSGLGYSYDLTMNDGNVAAGTTLHISANTLAADETLTFNGSAESDGSFVVYGGAGADSVTGGQGADALYGEGGADQLSGGTGSDTFAFIAASDSTSGAMDEILDFANGDRIGLSAIDAIPGGEDDGFTFIGASAFTHAAGELRAFEQSAGHWQVEGDIDGDGAADLVIAVTTDHPLTGADFLL